MPLPPLRSWQEAALCAWEDSGYRGCFEVATGGGKTTFALSAAAHLKKLRGYERLLIVVPTTALLDQWYVELTESADIMADDIQILSGQDLNLDHPTSLAVVNTARRLDGLAQDTSDVLQIVDECHRAGSPQNARALLETTAATIGLSATPYREFDDGFERLVVPRLGPVLFSYSLADAIRDGVLANLSLTYVKIPLLPSEQAQYERLSRRIATALSNGDDDAILEQILRTRARLYNSAFYRLPVLRRLLAERRGKRTLVFLESIDAASEALAMLTEDGHSVTIYHSRMSPHFRRSNLRLFRQGIFDVLIACRALDEGFNVPEAEAAIIVAGTSTRRQRVQRVGRVLRSIECKDDAEVVTLYATPVEEARLVAESEDLGLTAQTRWLEALGV